MVATALLGLVFLTQAAGQTPAARPARPQAPTKPLSDLKQRGRQLLETSAAEAGGLSEAAMRGYTWLQVARVYATFDHPQALDLLNQAWEAASGLPDDSKAKPRLEQQILEALAPLDPARADELLPQVPADARQGALQSLLDYYGKNKQFDRAFGVVERLAADGQFPFTAATRLLSLLPPESAEERQRLFQSALQSFRAEPQAEGYASPGGDFGAMIVQEWKNLPPALVRQAIDELLSKAESPEGGSMEMTMFGGNGTLAFNSRYEWRLFQVLPILRQIDESAAEALLKKYQSLDAQLQRYPQGMASWQGDPQQPSVNGTVVTTRDSTGPRSTPPAPPPRVYQMLKMVEQMNRVLRDVRDHPQDALAQALAISDDTTRLRTLILVARATQKSNASVCTNALGRVVDQSDRVELQEASNLLVDAGRVYLAISDNDGVKTAAQRGASAAAKMYRADTNPDDPNQATKAYWPSTNAWTNFARLAAEVSPDTAVQMVNEIPDEEIRPLVRIALAATWLGAPTGSSLVLRQSKSGTRTLPGRE